MATGPDQSNERGRRAEEVARWYFRLNGCFQTGFVLHADQPGRQITDADICAVRFPHTEEKLRDIRMTDDRWFTRTAPNGQILLFVAEITQGGPCKVNGPWTDHSRGGMEKVVQRFGFADAAKVPEIVSSMYDRLWWGDDKHVLTYVAIGERASRDLATRYPKLVQLTWEDIARFLWDRFHAFGEIKGVPAQWPIFGRHFAKLVERDHIASAADTVSCVTSFIKDGITDGV